MSVNGEYAFSGDEEGAGCAMDDKSKTFEIKVGGDQGSEITITYETIDGLYHTGAYAEITAAEVVKSPCEDGGGCSDCSPGSGSPSAGSGPGGGGGLSNSMSMGEGPAGQAPGSIKYGGTGPDPGLTDPASLKYLTANQNTEIITDANGVILQVLNNYALASVDVVDAYAFKVEFYEAGDAGTKSGDVYQPTGSPFVTWTYENPDKTGSTYDTLLVKKTVGANTETWQYNWISAANSWEMVSEGGKKKELTSTVIDSGAGTRTVTYTIKNEEDEVIYEKAKVFATFAWGEQLVSEIEDPDGAALTTTYAYFTDEMADGDNYSNLKHVISPSGYWERYQYDSLGRRTKTVKQFLDEPVTALEDDSRVITTTYQAYTPQETTIEKLQGVEIARRYRVNGFDYNFYEYYTADIVCQTKGAAWNASDNLVTKTFRVDSGAFEGRTSRVVHSDGTVTTYAYALNSGQETVTEKTGEPEYDGWGYLNDIVKGKRIVSKRNENGALFERKTHDIETNLLIGSEEYDLDEFGRAVEVAYLDGTTEEFAYETCGLIARTDRHGIVTDYFLGCGGGDRGESRQGIRTFYEEDAAGRRTKVIRKGLDDSEIVLEENTYDVAGRLTATTTPLGTTTFEEKIDANGHTVKTITYADESERIERYAPDSSLLEVSGSAAFPRKYAYGVDEDDGEYRREILVGIGASETEWRQEFFDMAGRIWKTLYPDDAKETSHWNTKGQLARRVDADGVTTLYAYNTLGEQEYTALDADADNTIDFEGDDRIRRVRTEYLEENDETVRRQTVSEWSETGEIVVSQADTSMTSLDVWQRSFGVESHQLTEITAGGDYTVTTTSNSGATMVLTYEDGYLVSREVTGTNDEEAGLTVLAYDAHGRLASETTDGLAAVTTTYTEADLVESTTQTGDTISYEYDRRGNRTKIIRPGDVETEYEYFPTGLLKKVFGKLEYPVEHTYDPQGRPKTLTTTGQTGTSTTTWNYDAQRGWLVSKRYADNKGPDYTYTPAGRPATRQWARLAGEGRLETAYDYTAMGDLDTVTYSDSTAGMDFAYDRRGRRTGIVQGGAMWAFALDPAGQMTEETVRAGRWMVLKWNLPSTASSA